MMGTLTIEPPSNVQSGNVKRKTGNVPGFLSPIL
jgi:hypothetical protein